MPNRSMPQKANSIDSGMASGHDQRRPQVAQEGEQHGDDQQAAFEQVLAHRVDDVVDQFGAVVDRLDLHVRRQASPRSTSSLSFMAQVTVVAVLAHQHEAQAQHHFALAVGRDGPAADFVADRHVGHVARRGSARRPWP